MKFKQSWNGRQLMMAGATVIGLVALIVLVIKFGPSSVDNGDKDSASDSSQSGKQEPAPTPSVTDPGNQQSAPSAATTITITADGFSPAAITIARGTTITWANADSVPHAVDPAADSEGPHSPQLAPKSSFNYSFQKAGTFTYVDPLSPNHTGTVTVTNGD